MIYKGEHELSYNNHEEYFTLPVNPDVVQISTSGSGKTWHTTEVGDFKSIGFPSLMTIKLSSFFPAKMYPFCVNQSFFLKPEFYIAMIRKWQHTKRPIRYISTGIINEAFSIESFSYNKEMGTGDIYYELVLQQYRFARDTNRQSGAVGDYDKLMIVYTLKKGDTLCKLAEEWLNDSDRYKDIAKWNNIKDVNHPYEATKDNFHQIEIICEYGTSGYKKIKEMKGVG